jgi:hypothetical protein
MNFLLGVRRGISEYTDLSLHYEENCRRELKCIAVILEFFTGVIRGVYWFSDLLYWRIWYVNENVTV